MSAEENLTRYPYAMALKCALRSYSSAIELLTPELQPMVMQNIKNIRESIAEAFGVSVDGSLRSSSRRVRWDGKEIAEWVAGLTELVSLFEERVEMLLQACDSIDNQLKILSQIEYNHEKFLSVVQTIQKIVDELSLAGYSELSSWVGIVNEKMSKVLCKRLEDAIIGWCKALDVDKESNQRDSDNSEEEKKTNGHKLDRVKKLTVPSVVLEIILRNQTICTQPSLPNVRSQFLQQFHEYIAVVCSLPAPSSGRFEVFDSGEKDSNNCESFDHLVKEIPVDIIAQAYSCIECHMEKISVFITQWLAYQDLWDVRINDVASFLGDNMVSWRLLLDETTSARNALDIPTTSTTFGPILIKYDKVYSQISLKYDSWQKELQSCYAGLLKQKIVDTHQKVCDAKSKLEDISLDGTVGTYDLVLNVTFLQEMKDHVEPWGNEISNFLIAERVLKQQRHIFNSDWMEASRLQGQFQHMEYILSKRVRLMEEQLPLLQTRVIAEDKVAEKRTLDLLAHWDAEKPLQGNMTPVEAKEVLSRYECNLKKAKCDDDNLLKAKDALGLEARLGKTNVTGCLDELQDLKEVWDALSAPFESLDKVKQTLWVTAAPRKIRIQLEEITSGK